MINMLRKEIKFSIQRVYFPQSYFERRHYCKRFNSIGKFKSLTFQLRAMYFHTFAVDVSVYFDFAKAFDTVNHDLLLQKLKHNYKIDARLLKFLKLFSKSSPTCLTGKYLFRVLTREIWCPTRPLLFVLFISDIGLGISTGTNICLFADDTKIWRSINSCKDCDIFQNDIDYLVRWCSSNEMKFHPDKCRVLSVNTKSCNSKLTFK